MLGNVALKNYFSEKSNDLIMVRMFIAFGTAIFWVTPSLFLKSHGFSDSIIGLFIALTGIVSLAVSISSTIVLEKFNEYKLFLFTNLVPLIFLIFLVMYPSLYLFLVFMIFFSIFNSIRKNSFAIIFKDVTTNKEFTKKESLLYSFLNVGWFVGPFIGGLVIENYGFVYTFGVAAFFYFVSLLFSSMFNVKLRKKNRKTFDFNLIDNIHYYFKRKQLIYSYLITFASSFWYVMIFTYIPLFIIGANLGASWVGIFLSLTQFPLVLVQFRLDWFINRIGSKKILFFSFLYLSFVSFVLFFYSEIYFTIFALVSAAFALGFIEPLREIYFFKNVKAIDEEKTYPIFNTSFSLGSIFGRIALSGVLIFLPKNFIFLLVSIVMLFMVFLTLKLKNYKN